MKVAISLGAPYAADIKDIQLENQIAYVVEAEHLGVESAWSAEAWGHDAITPPGVSCRTNQSHPPGNRHHADRLADARDDCHDGVDHGNGLFPTLILVAKYKLPLFLIKYGERCILTMLSGRIDSTAQAIFCMNSAKCD